MAKFELGNTLAAALGEIPDAGTARTVETIGAEIRSLTAAANYSTVWFAVEIGRRLTEAKAVCGHGKWLDFLREQTQFSERRAADLMRVFREYGDKLSNSQTYANLSYSNALALLSLPESEREEFVEVHDVENMRGCC